LEEFVFTKHHCTLHVIDQVSIYMGNREALSYAGKARESYG